MRANREHPEQAEGFGHTYNHAPNMIYWNSRFYCHWVSNPASEHIGISRTCMSVSEDGLTWGAPVELFPPYPLDLRLENGPQQDLYEAGKAYACMHQRAGFYAASSGRLLALGYYGISPEVAVLPCAGRGIGRVVREIYADGQFGPIHFLLMNNTLGYDVGNALYPMYTASSDRGFAAACEELLADKLVMLQFWEENRDCEEDLFALRGAGEAFNYYRLDSGTAEVPPTVVGLWKHGKVSKSADGGRTWLPVKKCPSLVMSGGKIWGQRTGDGRFALVYNPSSDSCHRWPLAAVTSDDGAEFRHMLCAVGEVPPQRYWGFWRDYGPQYVRGLECETAAPDGGMWLCYSMNKEDIWVSRLPSEIGGTVTEHARDDFEGLEPRGIIPNWNIYSPKWAQVSLESHPTEGSPCKKAIRLRHSDPYDYAKAVRVFPQRERVRITLCLEARQNYFGRLEIDVADWRGLAVFRVIFDSDRTIKLKHGNGFTPAAFYGYGVTEIEMTLDCREKTIEVVIGQPDTKPEASLPPKACYQGLRFFGHANTIERIEFRTGSIRRTPAWDDDVEFNAPRDLPGGGERLAQEAVYYIHSLFTGEVEE
jgi:hypothetical protein